MKNRFTLYSSQEKREEEIKMLKEPYSFMDSNASSHTVQRNARDLHTNCSMIVFIQPFVSFIEFEFILIHW